MIDPKLHRVLCPLGICALFRIVVSHLCGSLGILELLESTWIALHRGRHTNWLCDTNDHERLPSNYGLHDAAYRCRKEDMDPIEMPLSVVGQLLSESECRDDWRGKTRDKFVRSPRGDLKRNHRDCGQRVSLARGPKDESAS